MTSFRRRILAGAAFMACLTMPGMARADLSFGELQDGLPIKRRFAQRQRSDAAGIRAAVVDS